MTLTLKGDYNFVPFPTNMAAAAELHNTRFVWTDEETATFLKLEHKTNINATVY